MKIAIMQPYIFPYLGYFQLINAVDKFVFYDDVNFIKKGWINRNNILIKGEPKLFTIPLSKPSQNKLIKEIEVSFDEKWLLNFQKKLEYNYKKAPFYYEVLALINDVFSLNNNYISDLAINSVIIASNYLGIETEFTKSSFDFKDTKGLSKADRLIEISKRSDAKNYINPIGGKNMYNKDYFEERGVQLNFMESNLLKYNQFNNPFVSGLSIIDVLMFNSKEEVKKLLKESKLI